MTHKLTSRQIDLIGQALCHIAVNAALESSDVSDLPEKLKTIRCALVSEFEAIEAEIDRRTGIDRRVNPQTKFVRRAEKAV